MAAVMCTSSLGFSHSKMNRLHELTAMGSLLKQLLKKLCICFVYFSFPHKTKLLNTGANFEAFFPVMKINYEIRAFSMEC